ncbi:MAG: hypothetical protein C3F13_06215 [Anaerolineales bacterium]|nr:hypothetical protein [Anaerolineae bacterium]PWB54609.1 MAG: hypothetical protein C3F13_06215 [Anaerolineales bacterium]
MKDKWWAKVLRIIGIVLMGLTAVFTLMGGIGTTCVALNPTGFSGSFSGIAPYQWLYILFVIVTTAFGVMGVRAVVLLIRNRPNAYRYSLIALIGGSVVGVIHMLVSRSLRGSSMPVDMVTYVNLLTLVVFLIYRIPGLWEHIGYGRPHPSNTAGLAGGSAAIAMGAMCLTIQYFMGFTHTITGVNYADVWHMPFQIAGWSLVIIGLSLVMWSAGLINHKAYLKEAAPASN